MEEEIMPEKCCRLDSIEGAKVRAIAGKYDDECRAIFGPLTCLFVLTCVTHIGSTKESQYEQRWKKNSGKSMAEKEPCAFLKLMS